MEARSSLIAFRDSVVLPTKEASMTAATLRVIGSAEPVFSDADLHSMQVSGLTPFDMNRWREAILYYLFGVWGNKDKVMYRPKINFGGVTIRLDKQTHSYYAYGKAPDAEPAMRITERALIVTSGQADVEVGLISFVKNDAIDRLTIVFPNQGYLYLWKTDRRGEYRCAASGIARDLMET